MSPDKTWKAFERRVAAAVGGKRHPVTGERAGADVESDRLVIQVKRGYTLPKYLRGWLQGMIDWRNANAQGKLACVVWQKRGGPDKDALVFLRLEEFQQLLGDTKRYSFEPANPIPEIEMFKEPIK